jgi:hypothetical protein
VPGRYDLARRGIRHWTPGPFARWADITEFELPVPVARQRGRGSGTEKAEAKGIRRIRGKSNKSKR